MLGLVYIIFPDWLTSMIVKNNTDISEVFFANIPGPNAQLVYRGKALHEMFGFSPTFFKMGLNLGLVSYGKHFRVTMTNDANTGFSIEAFKEILEQELDGQLSF